MPNGLGRGLGSLIPNKKQSDSSKDEIIFDISGADKDKVWQIPPAKIKANPSQPRQDFSGVSMDELAESIKEHGIIQPLIATRTDGGYELIAGERRLRAAVIVGLEKVPVIVRDAEKQEKLEMALIENLQRKDLNAVETGFAYQKLADEFNLSHEEIAKKVGKSRPTVTNTLRLLQLPEEIKQALREGRISEGHAKYLLGLDTEEKQMILFRKIIRNNLTITDVGQETRRMGGTKEARIKINYRDKDKEFAFREFFGARVEIRRKKKGGQVIIDFSSDDELEGMAVKVKS